jgi:hypothetical protein
MITNDGKYLEYLVQLVEKSISPDSIVEHDIKLPILNSREGATTQCDIVIRTGNKPRETITIIEIQDRKSQVKPNDFRGWQQKLQDVGAQHLICVSRKEFPSSIKEKAAMSGNTVRLMTLKELSAEQIPLNFFKHQFRCIQFDVTQIAIKYSIPQSVSQKVAKILKGENLNQKLFSINKVQFISIYQICRNSSKPKENQKKGRNKLKFNIHKKPIYYYYNEEFIPIGIEMEYEWINDVVEVPVSTISYEQNDFGSLAWVIEATHNSPRGFASFKIPVTYNGKVYQIRNMMMNIPLDSELSINIEKESL